MSLSFSIHSNIRDYEVSFEENEGFIDTFKKIEQTCFVVDENVWKLYSSTMLQSIAPNEVIVLPISEEGKSLVTVQRLYDRLVEFSAKRNLTMISIGGGILQDVSGFAASTLYRGIPWIFVPTTLLAQADSCIGSKTSLNYGNYKNLLGTFYPPNHIYIHVPFLKTLQDVDFFSGFGEVIKLHLMGGRENFNTLLELCPGILLREPQALFQSVRQSLAVKLNYMEGDEFDLGRRNLLNYGHDFGHALESTSDFAVPHGQAVIFGMLASNIVARQRGLLSEKMEKEISEKILMPNLLIKPQAHALDADALVGAMKKDKKRIGDKLALIMMNDDFVFSRVNDLAEDEVSFALKEVGERLRD
jgi:3-dehydroquinate synthase